MHEYKSVQYTHRDRWYGRVPRPQGNFPEISFNHSSFQMEVDVRGEGFRSYYITKIEELQLIVAEKSQNLRRLQAQRNELNAKGKNHNISIFQCKTKTLFTLLLCHS